MYCWIPGQRLPYKTRNIWSSLWGTNLRQRGRQMIIGFQENLSDERLGKYQQGEDKKIKVFISYNGSKTVGGTDSIKTLSLRVEKNENVRKMY